MFSNLLNKPVLSTLLISATMILIGSSFADSTAIKNFESNKIDIRLCQSINAIKIKIKSKSESEYNANTRQCGKEMVFIGIDYTNQEIICGREVKGCFQPASTISVLAPP